MTVSIVMVRALVGVLERTGVSREQLLREAGFEERWLDGGTGQVSLEDYVRVLDAALRTSGDPALGLHFGERARSMMFDVIGPLTEHAGTLREMLDSIVRYSRLMAPGHEPELHEQADEAWIRFPSLRGNHVLAQVTAEFVMSAMLPMLGLFAAEYARPTRVMFTYEAPAHAAEYTRIFGGAERFAQPHTQLELPRSWLDKLQPYRNPELYAVLKDQAERTLGRLERDASLSERIAQLLAKPGAHAPTVHEIAQQLDMSARSLRRRMLAEGVSYTALLALSRTNNAKRMLENPSVSIQETAHALGFASAAAFHRAFKRWTGMTPKQYRDSF